MKFIDDFSSKKKRNRDARLGRVADPQEKPFLMDIMLSVANHFFHADLVFILTNNINQELVPGKKNIVFISGNEAGAPLSFENEASIIFENNFFPSSKGDNRFALPIGLPEYMNHMPESNSVPIKDRKYDTFFCGRIWKSRKAFKNKHNEELSGTDLNCYFRQTYPNNPKRDLSEKKLFNDFKTGEFVHYNDYFRVLQDSKISFMPVGVTAHNEAHDNYRYYESLLAGTINVFAEEDVRRKIWFYEYPLNVCINNWDELTYEFVRDTIDRYSDFNLEHAFSEYRKSLSKLALINRTVEIIGNRALGQL